MDAADAWGRSSSSSSAAAAARRLQARYDLYMGFDDADAGGDEAMDPRGGAELYNCPFCGEDFDFVSLCCHIEDEHAVEAKSGVCPICATRVGMDLIGHLTMQHGSYFKAGAESEEYLQGPILCSHFSVDHPMYPILLLQHQIHFCHL